MTTFGSLTNLPKSKHGILCRSTCGYDCSELASSDQNSAVSGGDRLWDVCEELSLQKTGIPAVAGTAKAVRLPQDRLIGLPQEV